MPKKEVLQMCEIAIRKDLGSLDDIPHELANTVANVYYRYFNQEFDVMKQGSKNPFWIPKQVKRQPDLLTGFTSFVEDTAKFTSDFKVAPKSIQGLREIDKRSQPNAYQFAVDYILDCLKYDIKDAHKKIGLRRMIERKFSKANKREIPNLIDLLDI
ncbi:MAG: hypothetical protein QUS13_07225 [Smithella sp.]|nr:hypothetical protein [Smithella sp.]